MDLSNAYFIILQDSRHPPVFAAVDSVAQRMIYYIRGEGGVVCFKTVSCNYRFFT